MDLSPLLPALAAVPPLTEVYARLDARAHITLGLIDASKAVTAACTPDPRHPKRQLRGVWIATVNNIDWPSRSGLSPARQRAEQEASASEPLERTAS